VVSYAVMLDVPSQGADLFTPLLLPVHRRQIGTRKGNRRLGCYKQAVFALAWFRDKDDIRGSAAASGCRSPPRTGASMRSSRCWRPTPRVCGEQLERALARARRT